MTVEVCPRGWDAIFEGHNTCSNGACCSIHGLCGTSTYHCTAGVPPSLQLVNGFVLLGIWLFWFLLGVEKRCISLMEDQYKKRGIRVEAQVMEIRHQSYWAAFRNMWCLFDDVRMCMRKNLIVEYETRASSTLSASRINEMVEPDSAWEVDGEENDLETPLVKLSGSSSIAGSNSNDSSSHDDLSMPSAVVVRRQILLSHHEARKLRVSGTICLYVLPEYPCSGYPRTQVDNIILKRRKFLLVLRLVAMISLGIFCKLTMDVQSLMSSKNAGWSLVFLNLVWTPPIGYYIARFVERKRLTEWIYQGDIMQHRSVLQQSVRN